MAKKRSRRTSRTRRRRGGGFFDHDMVEPPRLRNVSSREPKPNFIGAKPGRVNQLISQFKKNEDQSSPPTSAPSPTPKVVNRVAMLTKQFEDKSKEPEPHELDGKPDENQNVHAYAARNANQGGKKRKSVKKRKMAKKKSLKKRR